MIFQYCNLIKIVCHFKYLLEITFKSPIDASPKYVLRLDKIDMFKNGITHLNIIDFLENKVDLFLS